MTPYDMSSAPQWLSDCCNKPIRDHHELEKYDEGGKVKLRRKPGGLEWKECTQCRQHCSAHLSDVRIVVEAPRRAGRTEPGALLDGAV